MPRGNIVRGYNEPPSIRRQVWGTRNHGRILRENEISSRDIRKGIEQVRHPVKCFKMFLGKVPSWKQRQMIWLTA